MRTICEHSHTNDKWSWCESRMRKKVEKRRKHCRLVAVEVAVIENVIFRLCLNPEFVSFPVSAGLAVGLDPQGYGNPDFCWLSVHDTLIWSFAGPIFVVVLVSAWLTTLCILTERRVSFKGLKVLFQPSLKVNIVVFVLAAKASCGRRQKAMEKSGAMSVVFHFTKQWSNGTTQWHWSVCPPPTLSVLLYEWLSSCCCSSVPPGSWA